MYGVGGAGALVVGLALVELISGPVPSQWVFFAALTCLGGLYAIKIPSLYASFSVFETFVFALVLLFGPAPAIATAAAESVIEAALVRGRPRYRTLFDIAQPAVSVWFAATVFYGLSGVDPLLNQVAPLRTLFVPLFGFRNKLFRAQWPADGRRHSARDGLAQFRVRARAPSARALELLRQPLPARVICGER